MAAVSSLFLDHAINGYTAVGTHGGTCGASYALFHFCRKGVVVAPVVDLVGLQDKNIARTCNHA
jgi:hypothetical protein